MNKPKVVLKFGGTSLASIECIRKAAKIIKSFSEKYSVVVVASAMAKFTNTLIEYTSYFYKVDNNKEYDSTLAAGEQISTALLALAVEELDLKACSVLAWQVPIITNNVHANAEIINVSSTHIKLLIKKGYIPIIAGFQGVTKENTLTTLGRGGSDTTAVAVAKAIKAKMCYIYTDVDGIFVCDPNVIPISKKINEISFSPLIEMTNSGAKVIHSRAVELAFKYNIAVCIKSTFNNNNGTIIKKGKLSMEGPLINAIASTKNEVMFKLTNLPKEGNVDLKILNKILEKGINIDLISKETKDTSINMIFVISRDNLDIVLKILKNNNKLVDYKNVSFNTEVAKISIIGIGLQTHSVIMEKIFKVLVKYNISILAMSLANLKIVFLINENNLNSVVDYFYNILHTYTNK